MIKNKKGITLIELVISIALISIVIMFLFRLLIDVRYNDNNVDYNRENQQQRAIVIKKVQTDFLEKKLIGMKDLTSSENQFVLEFQYQDGTTGTFKIDMESGRQFVSYQNNEGIEKWWVEKVNDISKYNVNCVNFTHNNLFNSIEGDFFFIRFTIPMVVKKSKNNAIDDLEFIYVGEKKTVDIANFPDLNKITLGKYQASTCG